MKTVLITGATGFLGSHLLETLLKCGYKVVILKRSTSDIWRIKHLTDKLVSYDVDSEPLDKAFEEQKIDVVMHTACHYGRNSYSIEDTVEGNLMFGVRVLDACLKYKVATFFNTDTLLEKGLNDYTLSKKHFVEWLSQKQSQIQVVNIKLEHMYGPKDDATKFIVWLLTQFQQGKREVPLTSGNQKRDFIYIDDIVSAYMLLLEKLDEMLSFNEFNVATGKSISVKVFVQKLKSEYEKECGKVSTELRFGAIPLRSGEPMDIEVDISLIEKMGWKPKVCLDKGLKNVVEEL